MIHIDFPFLLMSAVILFGLVALVSGLIKLYRRFRSLPDKPSPTLVESVVSLFPIILLVWVIRSFIVQPYRVPTGSLEPTVSPGDFIIVNQFAYGLRMPVFHTKFLSIGEPKRGDLVVFYWPPDPQLIFIKRMIGLPGDLIRYQDKVLYIDGRKISQSFVKPAYDREPDRAPVEVYQFKEQLDSIEHAIFIRPDHDTSGDFEVLVPEGYYFVMGDNRDNSSDSRVWGFVPEGNLIGKAWVVAVSWDHNHKHIRWHRIGRLIH